jgi:hypothetical protein
MHGRAVVLISILAAGTVHASDDPDAIKKSLADLRRKDPAKFMRAVQWNLCVAGNYLAPPYSGVEDDATRAALAKFAREKSMPAASKLDVATFEALGRAVDALYFPKAPMRLAAASFTATGDYVLATGTWEATAGPPVPFELNTVQIYCTRPTGCEIAEADVLATNGSFMLGHPTVVTRRVERWDDFEIVTVPYDDLCLRTLFRIELATKTVTRTRLKRQAAPGVDCSGWVAGAVVWTLVNGMERQLADQQKHWNDFLKTKRPRCGPEPGD